MYIINATTIEVDTLVVNATVKLDATHEVVVNVPVVYPKTEAEVLDALAAREIAELKKFDSAPVLAEIKAQLDAKIGVPQIVVK